MSPLERGLMDRILQLSGCRSVHCEPFGTWVKAFAEGGGVPVVGYGPTAPEALIDALEIATKRAVDAAKSEHAAKLEQINRIATVEQDDPRDARIMELEREVAELQAKIRTAADALEVDNDYR